MDIETLYKDIGNNMDKFKINIDYIRGGDDSTPRTYRVDIDTDCLSLNGGCKVYKQKYQTDSELLGRFFRSLDIDFDSSLKNKVDEVALSIVYKRPGQVEPKNAKFYFKSDCLSGKCHQYKLTYETNCGVLGTNFKYLNFEYDEYVENGLFKYKYNIDYQLGNESSKKNVLFYVNHDCIFGPCNNYVLHYETSSGLFAKNFKLLHVDFKNEAKDNGVNDYHFNVDYELGTSDHDRKMKLFVSTDCITGRCKLYKHEFQTDSPLFARNFKLFNVDFVNTVEKGIDQMKLFIEYDLGNSDGIRNASFELYTDCIVGRCDVYKLKYVTNSEVLGRNFNYLNIDLVSKLNGQMNDYVCAVDFILGGEKVEQKTLLTMNSDCMLGSCNIFKMDYKTDNELLAYFFKYAKMDYLAKIEKKLLTVYLLTEYQLKKDQFVRSSTLNLNHDCITGDCLVYKLNYKSNDDDYLGRNFNLLDIDYKSSIESELNKITLNIDYKLSAEVQNRKANLIYETDCIHGKCRYYKLKYTTDSQYLGYNFKLLDTLYKFNINGDSVDSHLHIDYLFRNEQNLKSTDLRVVSDCFNGGCKNYKLSYSSNSEVLGYNFRVFNFGFNQKLVNKAVQYMYTCEYQLSTETKPSSTRLQVTSDCMNGPCDFYELKYLTDSEIFGRNFKRLRVFYGNSVKDLTNKVDVAVEYIRPTEDVRRSANFSVVTDCLLGACRDYTMKYQTDSEILGQNFRVLNYDFHRKLTGDVNQWESSVVYQRPSEKTQRFANIKVRSDCIVGACLIYALNYETDSELLGRNFKLLNIDIKTSYSSGLENIVMNVDYRRGNESIKRNANMVYSSDCFDGACTTYTLKYKTDSDILGKNFKYFNFVFARAFDQARKVDGYSYFFEYILGKQDSLQNVSYSVKHDCLSGACKYYSFEYDSNSELFSKYVKFFDMEYNYNMDKQMSKLDFNLDYIAANSVSKKNVRYAVVSDCLSGSCKKYFIEYSTNSEIFGKYVKLVKFDWSIKKNENNVDEHSFSIDYKTPFDDKAKETDVTIKSDCYSGACTKYNLSYKTNSEILAEKISLLKISYDRTVKNSQNTVDLKVDYKRGEDKDQRNASLTVDSNCSTGKCLIYDVKVKSDLISFSL